MPVREAVRPKQPPASSAANPAPPARDSGVAAGSPPPSNSPEHQDLDFTDSQFLSFDTGIVAVEAEQPTDPVQADIEQAAVLFANSEDDLARSVLEASARTHGGAESGRVWHVLFDLLQIKGDRAAFDKLGLEFAQVCETSPPIWRQDETQRAQANALETLVVLQGVITGSDAPEIGKLRQALAAKRMLRIDLGKLANCDDAAAGALGELLRLTRRQGISIALEGAENLLGRLESRLVTGERESPAGWLLLLELYQQRGMHEIFEERAVDYAVTFEVSPPSWEDLKPAAKASKPAAAVPVAAPVADDALFLAGELKNYSFGELPQYIASQTHPIIDFSKVKRLDFFSAGQLSNVLDAAQRAGKEAVIRNPHLLVAALMSVVGLNSVARIVVPKF